MIYFGFALADSMFSGANSVIYREVVSTDVVNLILSENEVVSCLNPSHQATIQAMKVRYGIDMAIPTVPPKVSLHSGDSILVMGVRGLPRLIDRHEYDQAEIDSATFTFTLYSVE